MTIRSEVSSSAIYAIAYNTKSRVLTVEFMSGREYMYPNIPFKLVRGLLSAPSAGIYFNNNIRQRAV